MDDQYWMKLAKKRMVGFAVTCGMELDHVEKGAVKAHCDLRPELLNPYDYVHGGAINTIMDTCGGMTASSASEPPRYVVTRSADVHYLRPIMGSRMSCRTSVVRAGQQMCLIRAEVFDETERLCATGLLEFFYLEKTIELD